MMCWQCRWMNLTAKMATAHSSGLPISPCTARVAWTCCMYMVMCMCCVAKASCGARGSAVPGFRSTEDARLDVGGGGSVDRHVPRLWHRSTSNWPFRVPNVACISRCGGKRGRCRFMGGYFMHAVDIVPPLFIALYLSAALAGRIEHRLRIM